MDKKRKLSKENKRIYVSPVKLEIFNESSSEDEELVKMKCIELGRRLTSELKSKGTEGKKE